MKRTTKNSLVRIAFTNSIAVAVYVILVASIPFLFENILPQEKDTILAPIVMLMLLVFSAALTGFLVFGKPVMLYLDNKKTEAIKLIAYTLFFLFVLTTIFLAIMVLMIII